MPFSWSQAVWDPSWCPRQTKTYANSTTMLCVGVIWQTKSIMVPEKNKENFCLCRVIEWLKNQNLMVAS